ncbi:uncharacterized protein CEXT_218961 [Caerostris extrusa]|uniref:Calponin-homology (CH) domain-containing protein n=1 Tax=Caerostris extrusa TaxID=172846 RepID=A0AAV4UI73_CAEEX|nr:uncharacterized protein CEXT_218961 [Caerostris extrusa]
MHLAQDEFSVPMILTPEDLASHNLDELSGMTYLSYFMKDDSPGYRATLTWVQKQLSQFNIRNFTTDWNDGLALCALVKAYGASVPDYTELKKERSFWEQNIQHATHLWIIGFAPLHKQSIMKDHRMCLLERAGINILKKSHSQTACRALNNGREGRACLSDNNAPYFANGRLTVQWTLHAAIS